MSKAKIYYFTLHDEQTKETKLEWFEQTRLEQVYFERITPDNQQNWINLTDKDGNDFLPLIHQQVKAGKHVADNFCQSISEKPPPTLHSQTDPIAPWLVTYLLMQPKHR